jgi:hypothetical protein
VISERIASVLDVVLRSYQFTWYPEESYCRSSVEFPAIKKEKTFEMRAGCESSHKVWLAPPVRWYIYT